MTENPFIATWELDPAQSQYELGEPPANGTYRIEANADGSYTFHMAWMTQDGKEMSGQFSGVPDGELHPYDNPAIADAISLTRVDENTLDSASFKGGEQIAHASRALSDDQQMMTVTQSGTAPDGSTFSNVAVYRRQTA